MDFSLLQPHTRHHLLRDIIALKSRWPYYLIMTVDPILRFNWVFYVAFAHDSQHSSIASFMIGFSEVTRRGLWTLLRVENEHCSNVKQYKASRDVPLPYHLDAGADSHETLASDDGKRIKLPDDGLLRSPSAARVSWTGNVTGRTESGHSTGVQGPGISAAATFPGPSAAVEEGRRPGEESLGMRRRSNTVGKRSIRGILADAHKQDFEKKRKPGSTKSGVGDKQGAQEEDDDDDDDEEDLELEDSDGEVAGELLDEREQARQRLKDRDDEDSD